MYVPILKNRTIEMNVLTKLSKIGVFDSTSVLPLIEVIQEKTRSNNKTTTIDDLAELLHSYPNITLMIDFFKSTKLNHTTESIRNYVSQSTRNINFCIQEISQLNTCAHQIIPVISYLNENFSLDKITYEVDAYRTTFPRLAFRIQAKDFEKIFSHIEKLVRENDIVLLDIESASHMNPVFKKIYKRISDSKKQKKFTSVIINANRPTGLTNKSMVDNEPITEIDNSLKELYNTSFMNKFDAFGDYACIVASLPSTGGAISPAGIFYSNENNFFVAFKGRFDLLSEFSDYIAPNIAHSEYWDEFTDEHHKICPGCQEISSIINKDKTGKNQGQWKMITMLHYIYTMYETQA